LSANFSHRDAYTASLGFGIINFVFAMPAFYTIDTFGRRYLLLATFPVSRFHMKAYGIFILLILLSIFFLLLYFYFYFLLPFPRDLISLSANLPR